MDNTVLGGVDIGKPYALLEGVDSGWTLMTQMKFTHTQGSDNSLPPDCESQRASHKAPKKDAKVESYHSLVSWGVRNS